MWYKHSHWLIKKKTPFMKALFSYKTLYKSMSYDTHCAEMKEFLFLMVSSKMQLYRYVHWTVILDIERRIPVYIWHVKHISVYEAQCIHLKQVWCREGWETADCNVQPRQKL